MAVALSYLRAVIDARELSSFLMSERWQEKTAAALDLQLVADDFRGD
jgi:hypothetical protein